MAEKVRKVERAVLVILGVGMTVIMFINACGRYLLGSTLLWAEETVRICFVWAMFIAITDLFVTGEHIGFDVIAMKNKLTRIIACVGTNLVLIFLGVNLVFFGMEIIHTTGKVPLPATKLPGMVFHIPGMIAGAVWIGIGLWEIIRMIKKKGGE